MRRIAQEEIKKEKARDAAQAKKWNWETATEVTTVSSGVGALYGSIPTLGAGTAAGAIAGATTGFLGYAGSIAYKNRRDFVEGYKKVSELEDPMGRCHP